MSRRSLLAGAAATAMAAAVGPGSRAALASPARRYDDGTSDVPTGAVGDVEEVIVIGAGWAGLAAANALHNAGVETVVLEGSDRLGGRAHTADLGGAPVDLGCAWIHEPAGNPLSRFARQAGVLTTSGDIEADVATFRFFDQRTGAVPIPEAAAVYQHYVLFDEALEDLSTRLGPQASMHDGITLYLDDAHLNGDERRRVEYFLRLLTELPDSISWDEISLHAWATGGAPYVGVGQGNLPVGGYGSLIDALADGLDIRCRHTVESVSWTPDGVTVVASTPWGSQTFTGSHVIVTSSLGVLKAGSIQFTPGLPLDKLDAIAAIPFGAFEKIAMRFDHPFWEVDAKTHILFASHPAAMDSPLFLDLHRLTAEPVLVTLTTAAAARRQVDSGPDAALNAVLARLDEMMGFTVPRPTAVLHTRWLEDPLVRGAYSAVAVGHGRAERATLAAPVDGRVLFAGEATSGERFGYSDGAFSTGIREAKRLLGVEDVAITARPQPLSSLLAGTGTRVRTG